MRLQYTLAWLIALCVSGHTIAQSVAFNDANLKASVEETLLIIDPTPTDMLTLISLNADFKGIENLTGLEYATNLQSLSLRGNDIEDITPLSGLIYLYHLDLSRNHISDISALSNLTNLTYLNIHWNQITDISAVSGLTALETLIVRFNHDLTDISPVSNLTGLKKLDIQITKVSDISSLIGLIHIEHLDMTRSKVNDLSTLSNKTNLKNLYLLGDDVRDLSPLLGLTSLEALGLNQNQLNQEAYSSQLQLISDHNPGIALSYDPNPRAPEAVKASKGNYADKVRVTWDEVPNGPAYTSYYQVYRSLSPNGIKAPVSPWLDIPNFEDNTALSGVTYYYWIRSAISQAGLSPGQYSAWDTGRTSDSYHPTLTLSSSCGGSIVLPGEGVFEITLSQKVPVQAVPMDTSLYVFSHWTGTAVDASSKVIVC